ncbi:TonB-dependent receptor [Tenacibaculum sp. UWU-22]|uniref:TonB-dependent receptor n=1 Tax=Tenacibaculum sp. UWU-22 TaxID=3234187 RepID=UPI0034DB6EBB
MKTALSVILFIFALSSFSQGTIKGKVIDNKTREGLPYVNVIIVGTSIGTITNENGEFTIPNSPLGYVKIEISYVGYTTVISNDYLVTQEKTPYVVLEISESNATLNEVVIKRKLFKKSLESPLSLQSLGLEEIEKNPGGNRDVIRVIQSLPGVASNPSFRNDIIIRGGSPSENKFYIDGIEVPVINHFQTQGATGGPVGIINVDLIRKVDFYASAFPASRGNTLSSIIEFTQKNGNPTALNYRASVGSSDAGFTVDGPITKNTTFIASARQSYLQFLFKAIKLPFLPTYNDFQFKTNTTFKNNSELSVIGLGAIDNFKLNQEVNNKVTDEEKLKRNNYILSNIPIQKQWNYTLGVRYKTFKENSTQQYIISRNEWKNTAVKYYNNTNNPSDLLYNYNSKETETKFRFENLSTTKNEYKINVGFGLEQALYHNTTFQKIANSTTNLVNFSSTLPLFKYNLFGQLTKDYFNAKLGVSVGVRFDANTYNTEMKNPINQFSPRISLSYALTNQWRINSTAGIYYQLPAYTILGFRDNNNTLVNKNTTSYIQASHLVGGLEFKPKNTLKFTLEGFYKKYKNYPFSTSKQISLANLGSDFGVIGNEQVTSTSIGKSYGIELLAQKKSYKGLYGILAYTYVFSQFKNQYNDFIPSAWDNRHLLTFTGGAKLKKNWEIGLRYRLVGGRPYTPYDMEASSLIKNYDITNKGILDYSQLNTLRFKTFTQLDARIDKTWYWKTLALNLYFDIQNALNSKSTEQPFLIPKKDANGNNMVDPNDNNKYILEQLDNTSGTVLPSIGLIVDF